MKAKIVENTYLNYAWQKTLTEEEYNFITDYIRQECVTPMLVNSENFVINHNMSIDISDCYFDVNGDLYTPTEYVQVQHISSVVNDRTVYETETQPSEYELLATKQQLKALFELYQKTNK